MQKIYSANDLPNAYIVSNFLSEAGIETCVLNQNAQGGMGEIPFHQAYPEVWIIDEADLDRAQALITTLQCTPDNTGICICPKCGEENPRHFQLCWQCASDLSSPD